MLDTKLLYLRVLWLSHLFEVSKLSWEKAFQQNWPWTPGRGPLHEKPLCFNCDRIPIGPANYFFHFPLFFPHCQFFVDRWSFWEAINLFLAQFNLKHNNTPALALASPKIMHEKWASTCNPAHKGLWHHWWAPLGQNEHGESRAPSCCFELVSFLPSSCVELGCHW